MGFDGSPKKSLSTFRLSGIVLNEKSHKNVRIQGDHPAVAPCRIASSISSRVTPRTDGLSMPQSDIRSIFSGRISATPSSRTTKAI